MIRLTVNGTDAVLQDGVWSSEDKRLETVLRVGFSVGMYPPSPSNGADMFAGQARAAAKTLGGKLTFTAEPGERGGGTDGAEAEIPARATTEIPPESP